MLGNKVTVTIHGLRELQAKMLSLPAEIKRGGIINRAIAKGARLIRDEARRAAPVLNLFSSAALSHQRKPGALRDNIISHFDRDIPLHSVVRVRSRGYIFAPTTYSSADRLRNSALEGNPNYWWLVEFGTSKMAARPFMRPAFEKRKVQAAEAIKQGLIEEIAKAAANPTGYALSQRGRRR